MILSTKLVEQSIDRHDTARFVKELVLVSGTVPLALVRKRLAAQRGDPGGTLATVLLVHGYGQNRYAWHLPLRSMSNYLARNGFDVFNLDLRGHGRSAHLGAKRPMAPADYALEDLPTAIAQVQRLTSDRPVFLVGHSLGGLVSYAATPRLSGAVAGMVTLGSPYHFLQGARGLARIGSLIGMVEKRGAQLLERDLAMELRLFGELVRNFRVFVESPLYPLPFRGYYPRNLEPDVLSQHMALAMDMGSVRVMREMFRSARQRAGRSDVPGGLEGFGEAFEAMRDVPLLVIAGSEDDLAPPASVRTAFERSSAVDKTYRTFPAGHIDLLVGRDAPLTIWPLVASWIGNRARS
jgi:polyhydroxyalkanoate synthase subunit PhaC